MTEVLSCLSANDKKNPVCVIEATADGTLS